MFYSRESDTSNWYVVLKAPPRSFDELEMFDESTYMSSSPLDLSRLDLSVDDEDECYVRMVVRACWWSHDEHDIMRFISIIPTDATTFSCVAFILGKPFVMSFLIVMNKISWSFINCYHSYTCY